MKSLTLLLVDDDADDKELFAEVVAQVNSEVVCKTAANGHEALAMLNNDMQMPDLVFLDLNMPKMNGFACLQHIRKSERISALPVIIYTTSNFDGDKTEAQKLGANGFIIKPHNMDTLKPILQQIFSQVLTNKVSSSSKVSFEITAF